MKAALHKIILLMAVVLGIFTPLQAYAGAALAVPTPVGQAVGQTVLTKMRYLGWAANDARFIATLPAIEVEVSAITAGAAAAGGGAAVGGGAVATAPVWLTVGAALAVGYGISLAIDQLFPDLPPPQSGAANPQLQIQPGPLPIVTVATTIQVPNPDSTPSDPVFSDMGWYAGSPIEGWNNYYNYVNQQPISTTPYIITNVQADSPYYMQVQGGLIQAYVKTTYTRVFCQDGIDTKPACSGQQSQGQDTWTHLSSGQCPSGYTWQTSQCLPPATISQTTNQRLPVNQYAQQLANSPIGNEPLNPAWIAAVANQAWLLASTQPGYQGLPYSQPITEWDVDQAFTPQNNPNHLPYPKVGDFLQPVTQVGTTVSLNPATQTNPNPSSSVDLGPDPGIPTPTLEATPTAHMILAPLLNLFPDLRSYVVPSHTSICPSGSIALFSRHLVLDHHCDLLESVRPTLLAVMSMVWVVVALFIVLRA